MLPHYFIIKFLIILILIQVLMLSATTEREYTIDQGGNISFTCNNNNDDPVIWIKTWNINYINDINDDDNDDNDDAFVIQANDKQLNINNASYADTGIYHCIAQQKDFTNYSNTIDIQNNDNITKTTTTTTTKLLNRKEYLRIKLNIRTTPGPVEKLYFKASTILGYLIWKFDSINHSGGYPIRSFTAEYRNVSLLQNKSSEWIRLDPINISPNVRQMEVYHLEPNTTYEFRIWANNQLGSGAIVTTNVTTLSEVKEEDLIRLIQTDINNFDPRVWIAAVGVFLGTLAILGTGLCVILTKEFNETFTIVKDDENGLDSIELIPNIILNPGFCESDEQEAPYTRTIIFGEDDESDGYADEDEDDEPPMEKFKRKVSIFFTGHTIRRI